MNLIQHQCLVPFAMFVSLATAASRCHWLSSQINRDEIFLKRTLELLFGEFYSKTTRGKGTWSFGFLQWLIRTCIDVSRRSFVCSFIIIEIFLFIESILSVSLDLARLEEFLTMPDYLGEDQRKTKPKDEKDEDKPIKGSSSSDFLFSKRNFLYSSTGWGRNRCPQILCKRSIVSGDEIYIEECF